MKIVLIFFFVLIFCVARLLSAYQGTLFFKKYFTVKYKAIGYIFIGKFPRTPKLDRSKMSAQGVFLHMLCLGAIVFSVYILFFAPVIEGKVVLINSISRYGIESDPLIASTVNDASVFLICESIFSLEMILLFLEWLKAIYNADGMPTVNVIINLVLNLIILILFVYNFFNTVLHLISFLNL